MLLPSDRGVNGTGMHTNVSITKDGKNLFWDPEALKKPVHLPGSSSTGYSRTATISVC